jgi:PASTA domain
MLGRKTAISLISAALGLGALAPAASADLKGVPYGTLKLSTSGKTVDFTLTFPFAVSSFDFNFNRSTAAVNSEDELISMSATGFPAGSCAPDGGGAEYPGCRFQPTIGAERNYWPTIPANTPIVGQVLMAQLSPGDSVFALGWNGNENPFVFGNTGLPVAQTHEITVGASSSGEAAPGGSRRKVPSVVGRTRAAAEKAIRRAGLKVGAVRRAHSKRVRRGAVISQSVSPGRSVAAGAKIGLVVSSGR